MKTFLHNTLSRLVYFLVALCVQLTAIGQPATVSYPFAIGQNSNCGSGSQHELHYYTYNDNTNSIANATGGLVGPCVPQLRIGGAANGTQRFTSSYASISYNPNDKNIYYFWTATSGTLAPGGQPRTYAWRWPIGTCPGTAANKVDTIRSFPADILGVAFDNSGNGYIIEFTNALPTAPPTYKPLLRSINFSTGALGAADTLALTGGAKIYQQGSGDVAISPSGQMFFVVNNKLFTPNYQVYTGTAANLTCTYIDTVKTTGNFVGLTYAQGETIAAFSGGGCPFQEINPLTAANTAITKSGTVYSASDMATVVSGIGATKQLVSVTPTGTPKQYDVVYDIYVRNYGNVDITNVQVTDDLTQINGSGNVSNVATSFVSNPAGLVLNGAFNGNSNKNLLNGTGTLPNAPVANNSFIIRISCRLSSIDDGKVYSNSAIATGTGFNSQPLRDSSTNGTVPDLNANDKPDDVGEGQPTPLLISITAQTPPCSTMGQVFYSETFGDGATAAALPASPGGTTQYTGSVTQPLAIDRFMLATNANAGDNSKFISLADHTTGTGRMMIVNADATNKVFYSGVVSSLCANQQYSLSFYAAFVGNSNYQTICDGFGGFKYPKVRMRVKDQATGLIITEIATADITSTSWNQYGMKWLMPAGYSNIIFELINDGQGGCGNDIAIDDIQLGTCNAAPVVTISGTTGGCMGASTTMSATLNDGSVVPGPKEYQWQISTDNATWSNIADASASTYTVGNLTASDVNKYYRVLVAAAGNMGSASCRYASPGFLLTVKAASSAPTGILKNRSVICPSDAIVLKAVGGTLGANANYKWYSGSCGGTLIGTGTTITVSPTVVTTYYVRIEGDCNTTACASIAITFNCDIDADKDGIPDVTESGGVDPKLDDDFDGIPNWKDPDYPGFTDSNGDGVNDKFDSDLDGVPNFLDRDSDNDGIPDVVEAGGVDANGDGMIDNYTDTDGDGLSQNVDANNTGAAGSGAGLGLPDLDGDGIPNYIDLDSDNDGIPDVVEAGGADLNNDGMIDNYVDADGDGFADQVDGDVGNDGVAENSANALLRTGADTNNDGRADSYPYKNMDKDGRPNPYDLDSDGDGIPDVIEAQFTDADYNGIIDGALNARGWSILVSSLDRLVLPNTDGTGKANVYDIDSDDDGIPDNIEGMLTYSYKLPSGSDSDNDGIDDAYDNIPGFGGMGISPCDTDGDTVPDYLDFDTDGDGVLDIVEGNDFNLNRQADDLVSLTGVDTDGDGLDDRFDMDQSSAKGTSAYMGNNGSFTGDASPGSRTMVQRSYPTMYDRDWRSIGQVLFVNFIDFKASLTDKKVELKWTVSSAVETDHFLVERSTNGIHFATVSKVSGQPQASAPGQYRSLDNVAAISGILYYRITAVSKSGEKKTSPIVRVGASTNTAVSLMVAPSPVRSAASVFVQAKSKGMATFYVLDGEGKMVKSFRQNVLAGSSSFVCNSLTELPGGVYYLTTVLDGTYLSCKFQVTR